MHFVFMLKVAAVADYVTGRGASGRGASVARRVVGREFVGGFWWGE
jgi:hypothetical protein